MQQTVEYVKQTFRSLLAKHATHESIIELLVSLRVEVDLSIDDTGWALWNICDRYAMLRDAKNQYAYQSEFHEWGKANLPPSRFHWIVSDGTQALTLIDGGYLDFWWRCYDLANEQCPQDAENRGARFESHRANAGAYIHFREFRRAETALSALERLLDEDPSWVNHDFAAATYRTLLLDLYGARDERDKVEGVRDAMEQHLGDWLCRTQDAECRSTERPLLGSWAQLNADRPPSAVFTAIHNAACALTTVKQYASAERFFQTLLDRGHSLTLYAEARYILACWENRQNRAEILTLLNASPSLTIDKLKRFAPELTTVVTDD